MLLLTSGGITLAGKKQQKTTEKRELRSDECQVHLLEFQERSLW